MPHDYAKYIQKKKASSAPFGVWLLVGIVAGLLIILVTHLVTKSANTTLEKPLNSTIITLEKQQQRSQEENSIHFDFYTLLPQRTIIVPTPNVDAQEPNIIYKLQIASFKHSEDANRQRAKLLLLGLDAEIDKFQSNNGDVWYRVQMGPFHSRSTLAKTRSILAQEGIVPLVIKKQASVNKE